MNPLVFGAIAMVAVGAAWLARKRASIKFAGAIMCGIIALVLLASIVPRIIQPLRCEFGAPADLPKLTHPAGYVYVIHDVEYSKRYKIGRTVYPKERLNAIRAILPGETDIVAIIDTKDAPTLEWQLHQRFTASRKRGEWFELGKSDIREICQI